MVPALRCDWYNITLLRNHDVLRLRFMHIPNEVYVLMIFDFEDKLPIETFTYETAAIEFKIDPSTCALHGGDDRVAAEQIAEFATSLLVHVLLAGEHDIPEFGGNPPDQVEAVAGLA